MRKTKLFGVAGFAGALLIAGCSDTTSPRATITEPTGGPSEARGVQTNPLPFPTELKLQGGAIFRLAFSNGIWFYAPFNAKATALHPHGLSLTGVPLP